MEALVAEAGVRGQTDLDLMSVDSTPVRARHHAAGRRVDPELLETVEKAVAEERPRAVPPCPAAWKPGTGATRHGACCGAVRA
ncbi:hypothetical protein ACFV2U_46385 [Streptomyces sp. NPDC059697]|uniref:hypothetical protein n=1 Tax=Streptomyces sp. NPDC059697 TaxID=3346912 RepID=UPI003691DC34